MKDNLIERAPLLRLALALMAGIVVQTYCPVSVPLLPVLGVVVLMALLLRRYAQLQSVAICLCWVLLGALLQQREQTAQRVEWSAQEVVYEAVVVSKPVEKPKTMAVDVLLAQNGTRLKCYIYKDGRSKALRVGDGLRIRSQISEGRTFVRSWNWRKATVSLTGLPLLERTRLWFLLQRERLLSRMALRQGLDGDEYAVVAAMALGDKSALTKDLKEVYSVTGASHVLALSGLHLGIIYTLLSLVVTGRRWRMVMQVLTVLAVWAFVLLVGMSVSVVRAALMLSVWALLSLGHRQRMSVNTLAFTAIVMLMVSPRSLFDVGFQMSLMAVFSILLWMPVMDRVVPLDYQQSHRLVKWLWSLVAVSLVAQMGVAPLIAYYFGRFSTYFLLTNLIVIPAVTLILYLSLASLIVPFLSESLLIVVAALNRTLSWLATLPGASIEGIHPSLLQVVMAYVIIFAVYLLCLRIFLYLCSH